MSSFFKIQPKQCRYPLDQKEVGEINQAVKRVLFFDPAEVYERISVQLKPFQRYQKVSVTDMFLKKNDGFCDCGCGVKLTGRQQRWAKKECADFTFYVWSIIVGRQDFIGKLIGTYYGYDCAIESCENGDLELDHIIGIKHGGGRSWLSNYQFLCRHHHVKKTRNDFKKT